MASPTLLRWESFLEELEAFIRSSNRQQGHASVEYAYFVVERFEMIIRSLASIVEVFAMNQPRDHGERRGVWRVYLSTLQLLVEACRSLASQWDSYIDGVQSNPYPYNYLPPLARQAHIRGRPSFEISEDQLLYLSSLSFTWTEIASLLGVSRMTIYRRRCNFNMLGLARNTVTDAQLRTMIREWKSEMPAIGETLVVGRLHASGVFVTRERVRCAIRAVDPLNTALQAPRGLTRRQAYSVPAPNSLWHIGERRNCGVFVCVCVCVWCGGGGGTKGQLPPFGDVFLLSLESCPHPALHLPPIHPKFAFPLCNSA